MANLLNSRMPTIQDLFDYAAWFGRITRRLPMQSDVDHTRFRRADRLGEQDAGTVAGDCHVKCSKLFGELRTANRHSGEWNSPRAASSRTEYTKLSEPR